MKKIALLIVLSVTLLFGGCRHEIFTTQYTIGCFGSQSGSVQGSQEEWNELEAYFSNHVEYNKLVSFESSSLAENDAKARQLLNEQLVKTDTAYVCSLLHSTDYFDYGIATLNANGEYRFIRIVRFDENGIRDVTYK